MKKEKVICVFAYNRHDHLHATLTELLKNDLSAFDVILFQDGPKDSFDELKTKKVFDVINSFPENTFQQVTCNTSNQGLANSVFKGLNQVFADYESAIVLEDDILIKDGFIEFLTRSLDYYANDEKVAGISGFSYYDKPFNSNYFLPIGCSWGWATWKRSWKDLKNDPGFYLSAIRALPQRNKFNFGSYNFEDILESALKKNVDSWAIQFYAHFFLKNQLFLFPAISLCTNIGFDDSGTHTKSSMQNFNSNIEGSFDTDFFPKPELNKKEVRKVEQHMRTLMQNDWKNIVKRRIYKIFR